MIKPEGPTNVPDWLVNNTTNIVYIDVRPVLANGKDPLKEILQKFKTINNNEILCVINTFVPYPLINLLKEKNALAYVEHISENEINSYFFKNYEPKLNEKSNEKIEFVSLDTIGSKLTEWPSNNILEIDVTSLPMPQPMEKILSHLDNINNNQILSIKHKKIPLYLLEELSARNFKIYICKLCEHDIRILIHPLKD